MAWLTAGLQRQKKFPTLQSLLSKRTVRQNASQQRTMLYQLAEVYELRVRTKKRKKPKADG